MSYIVHFQEERGTIRAARRLVSGGIVLLLKDMIDVSDSLPFPKAKIQCKVTLKGAKIAPPSLKNVK